MKIDVVIALYNGARWIEETLASVARQTLKPDKIIVVDDGSTDGSFELVSRFPGVTLLKNPKKGSSEARNFGLKHTDAPLIALLDHDDIWHEEHLQRLSEVLVSHPEIDMAISQYTIFDDGMPHHFDVAQRSFEFFNPWNMYPSQDIGCSASFLMVRRDAFFEVGGWPRGVSDCNDYVLVMKMSVKKPIARLHAKTVAYRRSVGSQYWHLRNDKPREHLALMLKEKDDLMDYFIKTSLDAVATEKIKIRNQFAHDLNDLIFNLMENKQEVPKDAILKIERFKVKKDPCYTKRVFAKLLAALTDYFSYGVNSAEKRAYYLNLIEKWPKEAFSTKEDLFQVIVEDQPGVAFYKEYLCGSSWNFQKLNFLFLALKSKFLNLSGRCHAA